MAMPMKRTEAELTDAIPDKLHPNVKRYWFLTSSITWTVFMYFAIIGLPIFLVFILDGFSVLLIGICLVSVFLPVGLALACSAWYFSKLYDSYTFLIRDDAIEINAGVWFKRTIVIPYEKVQSVTYSQGPVEKRFGIARVIISTFGFTYGFQAIPGIEDPKLLADLILRRVARTKNGKVRPIEPGERGDFVERQMLREIRELKEELKKGE